MKKLQRDIFQDETDLILNAPAKEKVWMAQLNATMQKSFVTPLQADRNGAFYKIENLADGVYECNVASPSKHSSLRVYIQKAGTEFSVIGTSKEGWAKAKEILN